MWSTSEPQHVGWNTKQGEERYDIRMDIDQDGDIDVVDIQMVASHWGEQAPFARMATKVFEGSLTVSIMPAEVKATGPFEISIKVDEVENLGAFEIELTYDPNMLQVEERTIHIGLLST